MTVRLTDPEQALPAWLGVQMPDVRDWERRGDHRFNGRAAGFMGANRVFVVSNAEESRYLRRDISEDELAEATAAGFDLEERTFRMLEARMVHELLPTCVVPGCAEKAPVVFTAAESGRLAGRDWQSGDEICLCPPHGNDVYRAQYTVGVHQLAEWLRPDARPDPLDEFDAELSYDGIEVRRATSRTIRLAAG
jgi:hypothetical protein